MKSQNHLSKNLKSIEITKKTPSWQERKINQGPTKENIGGLYYQEDNIHLGTKNFFGCCFSCNKFGHKAVDCEVYSKSKFMEKMFDRIFECWNATILGVLQNCEKNRIAEK